jgi:hypothetical protein
VALKGSERVDNTPVNVSKGDYSVVEDTYQVFSMARCDPTTRAPVLVYCVRGGGDMGLTT